MDHLTTDIHIQGGQKFSKFVFFKFFQIYFIFFQKKLKKINVKKFGKHKLIFFCINRSFNDLIHYLKKILQHFSKNLKKKINV